MVRLVALLAAVAVWLVACSPAFNWRELRPEGAGIVALFPCRPGHDTRGVALAGAPTTMTVWACNAGGAGFALAAADVDDPARVGPALQALRAAAVANVNATVADEAGAAVKGMTPQAAATHLRLSGRLADGGAVDERVMVFSKGTRVYQATVFGQTLEAEAADTFFQGLRLPGS